VRKIGANFDILTTDMHCASYSPIPRRARVRRRAADVALGVILSVGAIVPTRTEAQSRQAAEASVGRLEGIAYDSIYARPLSGATIQLAFASNVAVVRLATTDERGRFVFDSVAPGQWIIGASHPWLDSLAIVQLTRGADVKSRGITRVVIAVPSAPSLITQECGASVAVDSSGYVLGTLRSARPPHVPVSGTVRVEWPEPEIVGGVYRRRLRALTLRTAPTGEYSVCGVPPDGLVRIQAWSGADSTGILLAGVPSHGISKLDLTLGAARRIPLPDTVLVSDSSAAFEADTSSPASTPRVTVTLLRGTGIVRGDVRTAAGAPLANARATIWGTGVTATSGSDGRFALTDLPTGSHVLELRAIGYPSTRRVIDIVDGEPTMITAALEKPIDLTPVQIRALRSTMMGVDLSGFEQRRRGAIGRFFDTTQLARINAITPVDVFRFVPRVRVVPGPGGDKIQFRKGGDWCDPTIYVNGMPIAGDFTLDMYVNAADLRGVEIYTNGVVVPSEYRAQTLCGSVVLWTGVTRDRRQ
jgi:Carboxypeptidase regulatory-like domain